MKDETEIPIPKINYSETSVVPAASAKRCPVCNGFGTLKYGEIVCQACKGKGYVLVPTQKDGWTYGDKT